MIFFSYKFISFRIIHYMFDWKNKKNVRVFFFDEARFVAAQFLTLLKLVLFDIITTDKSHAAGWESHRVISHANWVVDPPDCHYANKNNSSSTKKCISCCKWGGRSRPVVPRNRTGNHRVSSYLIFSTHVFIPVYSLHFCTSIDKNQ